MRGLCANLAVIASHGDGMMPCLFHTINPAIACPMTKLLTWLIALFSLLAAPALAADPFTVAKVPVDARGDTAIQAQTRAIGDGQIAAARVLLDRLTLDAERAERGLPMLNTETVGPLIRGLSIDNERRSATRYLGDVTVAFNPSAVQQLLRANGLTMVTSQARPRLIVPVGFTQDSPLIDEIFSNRYAHSLTPLRAPNIDDIDRLYQDPNMAQLDSLAGRYDVEQLLILRRASGGLQATDYAVDTGETRRLSAQTLAGLVAQMEADWKETSAVPSDAMVTSTVSVLYESLEEWQRLQTAINNSAQVQDARLDALSKDGALMTIRYGSLDRLAAEMAQKGVRVFEDPRIGLVIRR